MTIAYKSWVSETGTLTGTDPTYTLPGTASTPTGNQFFRKISSAFTTTSTIVLTITAATGAETSVWTYTPGASGAGCYNIRSRRIYCGCVFNFCICNFRK